MRSTSRLALGFAALLVAAPALAECPGHSSVTAQSQSTPVPVAQSTPAPTSAPASDDAVILTQNQSQQTTAVPTAE